MKVYEANEATPGPWALVANPDEDARIINPETEGWIATVGRMSNARLIAAAPELLAALIAAVRVLEDPNSYTTDQEWDSVTATARAAIARATGSEGAGS